jgi:hypothetical protein
VLSTAKHQYISKLKIDEERTINLSWAAYRKQQQTIYVYTQQQKENSEREKRTPISILINGPRFSRDAKTSATLPADFKLCLLPCNLKSFLVFKSYGRLLSSFFTATQKSTFTANLKIICSLQLVMINFTGFFYWFFSSYLTLFKFCVCTQNFCVGLYLLFFFKFVVCYPEFIFTAHVVF